MSYNPNIRNSALLIAAMLLAGCNPFFSTDDIIFEQDYCGWKVIKQQYDASINVDCHWMILEKGRERREVYVTPDMAFRYMLGDTICKDRFTEMENALRATDIRQLWKDELQP